MRGRGIHVDRREAAREKSGVEEAQTAQAAQRAQAAKDEVARLASEDLARERLLQRTSLEKRRAEIETEQARTAATLERIQAAENAAARMKALETEGRALAKA